MERRVIGITSIIDTKTMGSFQVRVVVLCAMTGFVEAFVINSSGYVAPALAKAYSITHAALGLFFSAGLFGLMLGALFIAPVADRIGRRPVLVGSLILFGLGALASSFARSLSVLAPLWFLTGLGVGGAMPNSIAMTSEYVPHRIRALVVMLTFNGFILGSVCAGLAASSLIKAFGVSSVWVIGGALPLLLAPVIWFALPESVRFLAAQGGRDDQVGALMRRIDPALPPDGVHYVLDERAGKASVAALFQDGRARRTLLLWTMVFCSLLEVFLLSTWLPTQIASLGVSVPIAIGIGVLLQIGGLAGVALSLTMNRLGPGLTLAAAFLLGAGAIAGIALVGGSVPGLAVCVLLAGFGVLGGQSASNAVAATSYPTEMRSTGVGWYFGVGRIGSIVGPSLAGVLLAAGISNRNVFLMAVIPALCAAAAAATLDLVKTAPGSNT